MNSSARRLSSAFAVAALVLTLAAPGALAYDNQVASQVSVSGVCPPSSTGTATATLVATVLDTDGNPIPGIEVTWSTQETALVQPLSVGARVAALTAIGSASVTDAEGRATTSAVLPAGETTVVAAAGEARATAVVVCPAGEVASGGGLPRTDTAPGQIPVAVGLLITLMAAVSLMARRRATR